MEIFKIQQNNYMNKCEHGRVSASDFSVMITDAPTENVFIDDIEVFLNNH
jgi:hypothetical protein